jgi:nucleoside phosphorylase
MGLDWRTTLKTLLAQFEAKAGRSTGLHHLFVEVANNEREKIEGPSWFKPYDHPRVTGGMAQFGTWDVSVSNGLPGVNPGFREPKLHESFDESASTQVIRDGSGVIRAVAVPEKLRQGYFCGQPSEEVLSFESLANAAATTLAGSKSLHEHAFASDLVDLFRKPRGGVRYAFGEIPEAPNHFIAEGWNAGWLQFENGVLIDVPISESNPNASHWLLLLHRLGWRRVEGSGLRADRRSWNGNAEVDWEMLTQDWSQYPEEFSRQFTNFSKDSFYSVVGTKEAPLDLNLASAFALQLLLAEMSPQVLSSKEGNEAKVDYSNAQWHNLPVPVPRTISRDECQSLTQPRVGLLVATEVERQAVLRKMRPPKGKRTVVQMYVDNNSYFVGRLGLTDIVLCMTAMGSTGRDASLLVTSETIQAWDLRAVIMVGIAFGKDSAKQQIGNVLVSERVIAYEPQRVGRESNENRGSEHMARPVLLNRFRNVVGWGFKDPNGRECGIQFGPILSGEKLVDNSDFKNQLFQRYPSAIGGEMEGAGVAASAERHGREWIVVKAICDWGDGSKTKQHQSFAAAAAVDLVEHVLNQVGALDSLG